MIFQTRLIGHGLGAPASCKYEFASPIECSPTDAERRTPTPHTEEEHGSTRIEEPRPGLNAHGSESGVQGTDIEAVEVAWPIT